METLKECVDLCLYAFVESVVKHLLAVLEFVFICHVDVFSVWLQLDVFVLVKEFGGVHEGLAKHFCIIFKHVDETLVDLLIKIFEVR